MSIVQEYRQRRNDIPFRISDLMVSYGNKPVLWDVHLDIPEGKMVGIVGPNGAGKTTLIKAILGIIPRLSGRVLIYGRPYTKQRRLVSYIPQRGSVDWNYPITVIEVVLMGLYSQVGWIRRVGKAEREKAMYCLEQVGMQDYAHVQIGQLSGGQQQRAFLARALIQDAQLYFLDEPLAAVDKRTEHAIVNILQSLQETKRTVLMVHHDLNTVREYFDYLVLLNNTIIDSGPCNEVLTQENIIRTYGAPILREFTPKHTENTY